jgi:hypothetical protein
MQAWSLLAAGNAVSVVPTCHKHHANEEKNILQFPPPRMLLVK